MRPSFLKTILSCLTLFSFINACAQTKQEMDNIISFSKLYGYVKYFHPSDEAAALDWNRFAIYGSEQVSQCKNTSELQKVLTDIFKPIAPTLQIFQEKEKISFNKIAVMVTDISNYKIIAWQHSGVGLGNKGNIYESARTNRPVLTTSAATEFAPVSSSLKADSLQGKEFIFRGKVRMVSGDGQGQLWVRIDGNKKGAGFFDNMGNRPVKSKDWGSYEIKGIIDTDAASLVFGAMLVGTGSVEFDDLSLQVKDGDTWKELYKNTFTEDEKGKKPKRLYFGTTPAYNIQVEGNSENEKVLSIVSKEAEPKLHELLFNQYPKPGEYLEKNIGSGLKVILPLSLYGTTTQTYPAADADDLKTIKQKLAAINSTELDGKNLYTRLGDLVIAWNVFQHFYPYFDVVKTDWNDEMKEAVTSAYTDKTALDFQQTLRRLTAKLKDGHVRVSFSSMKTHMPLISWEWIENELVVTHVADSSITLKKGDIVKKIDNLDARKYFNNIYPGISAATKGWLEYRAQTEALIGEKGSVMKLNIIRADNSPAEISVTRNAGSSQYYASLPKEDSIKTIRDGVMYVNIGVASMQTIDKALPELKKSRIIICDLRGYPNGNHGFIEYLLPQKDTSTRWMSVAQTIYPDRERIAGWEYHGWQMKPAKTHLNAKIIFLTDGQAISYAESYMGFIENYKLATIVGQPTAGTNGNVNTLSLPGGYFVSFTGMRVLKHDGSTHHGVGIKPDIYVEKTIRGIREGRDEALEKALQLGTKAF